MAAAVRNALLKHLRIPIRPCAPSAPAAAATLLRRPFSDEVKGTFLDKSEVADRVITVVKNFQKVEPSQQNPRRSLLESSVYCNRKFPFRMPGNSSTFSTMGHSGGELPGQGTSAASPDPDQPRRIKCKRPDKTARHIINILNKEALEKVKVNREFPEIRPGYIIQLKVEVPENKRRLSSLKGIVIAMHNKGVHTTFRLRRLVAGVGVESVFPLYSPNIKEMKVLDKIKVRRAKLYYLRDRMNPIKK